MLRHSAVMLETESKDCTFLKVIWSVWPWGKVGDAGCRTHDPWIRFLLLYWLSYKARREQVMSNYGGNLQPGRY